MTPRRVGRYCSIPGCPRIVVDESYCAIHERERKANGDRKRSGQWTRSFYASPAWKRVRDEVRREEPFCRLCGEPTRIVDHIQSLRDFPHLGLVRANLRGLCKPCHDSRTARSGGGFGNPTQPEGDLRR